MSSVEVTESRRIGVDAGDEANKTLQWLKAEIQTLLAEVQQLEAWRQLTDGSMSPSQVASVMREIYREIALYQPDVIEATIAVIGQFPRSVDARRVRTMLVHQAEEWDHGEMAVRDFDALAGDVGSVRSGLMTPTAFATAAFWRLLAHKRLPFAYLGALYLFEGLTPIVTGLLRQSFDEQHVTPSGTEYIDFHATEDIKHAKVVDHLILEILQQFPERAAEVRFGFSAFRQVYPLPGWLAAVKRATVVDGL